MKKIIIIITLIILCLFGFLYYKKNNQINNEIKENSENNRPKKKHEKINEYVDNNPIKLGLYKYYGRGQNRKLITEYSDNWNYHNDISSFEVFFTNEEEISGKTFQTLFKEKYDDYQNIDNYKIGYQIKFSTNDKNINKTILSPNDTLEYFDYIETYLYDDYHREIGVWYSHTTEEEMNENTLLTSIKITAGKKVQEVTSDIKITAFTYEIEDDFINGYYRGTSKYSIIIKNDI